jgi:DNA polymerase III subunit delta
LIYLFYGNDELARKEYVARLLARAEDPMGDLNQTRLESDRLTFAELRHACDSIPFLSERRIVIVEGLLQRLSKRGPKEVADQLRDYIGDIPDYTRLFLLEGDVDKRSQLWKTLSKLSAETPPRVYLKEFALPTDRELPEWAQRRARHHGGLIDRRAAEELASFVGSELRLLDQELLKLVTYAGERPVTAEDVRLLVPYVQEATIWSLVDAIGEKDARRALAAAQQILEDDPGKAIYLHLMITRQVRLLLQVAELQALGTPQNQIQTTLGMSPFVLTKILKQVKNFNVTRLVEAFDRLLDSDHAMKTGADQVLAINLLIVELAGRRAA